MKNREIAPGDRVRCATATGTTFDTVALSGCRVDKPNALGSPESWFLSVSVQPPGWDHPINWPAADVERLP